MHDNYCRGPIGYVIFAEVSSAKLRSKTVGIGILINSLCGMVMNIVIPYLYVFMLFPSSSLAAYSCIL